MSPVIAWICCDKAFLSPIHILRRSREQNEHCACPSNLPHDCFPSQRAGSSLGPRPSRDSRTKEGLGTLVDFLGTPARFGMVQSDCRISLVTQLSRSNSRVTTTQTPPPGHDTIYAQFAITRSLLKCACA